jgi:hypothetical protein
MFNHTALFNAYLSFCHINLTLIFNTFFCSIITCHPFSSSSYSVVKIQAARTSSLPIPLASQYFTLELCVASLPQARLGSLLYAILSTWALHCVLHFPVTSMRCSLIVSLPMWSLDSHRGTRLSKPICGSFSPLLFKFSARAFHVRTSSVLYYFYKDLIKPFPT